MKRLENCEVEIHTLKMDLEDQSNSRKRYQLRASNLEEQKRNIEQLIVIYSFPAALLSTTANITPG